MTVPRAPKMNDSHGPSIRVMAIDTSSITAMKCINASPLGEYS